MSNILRIELTDEQRGELHALLARRDLTRYTRQRAECIRLLDRGKTAPKVADLLECNSVTVCAAVHRFKGGGVRALPEAPRPGRPAKVLGGDDRAASAHLRRPAWTPPICPSTRGECTTTSSGTPTASGS